MEAVEGFHAEHVMGPLKLASYDELRAAHEVVDPTLLAAIGIIDGYFERQPAVWHKEILWAMSHGIHVFGSASMGALRAAELAAFGMVGVGEIFEAYRDGRLEDDDEVAVAHGPEDSGYRSASDAMVNVRATLAAARAAGVIDEPVASELERIAKGLYYPERSYATIVELARHAALPAAPLDALWSWLPRGAVNQKRDDAIAMLETMRMFLADEPGPKQVDFVFEDSLWWEAFRAAAAESGLGADDARVLEALSSDAPARERLEAAALGWWFAGQDARRRGAAIDAVRLVDAARALCDRHGLPDADAVSRWIEHNRCDRGDLERLIEASAVAGLARGRAGDLIVPVLLLYLRWTGDYPRLHDQSGPGRSRDEEQRALGARDRVNQIAEPCRHHQTGAGDRLPADHEWRFRPAGRW
jgi:hypothetical protein